MMLTQSSISSWEEQAAVTSTNFAEASYSATENQPVIDPFWNQGMDSLLKAWESPTELSDPSPSRQSIQAAMQWLLVAKSRYPHIPPSCIIPSPEGGIIIDQRTTMRDGKELLLEWTILNDNTAEFVCYINSKIVIMDPIPFTPPRAWYS